VVCKQTQPADQLGIGCIRWHICGTSAIGAGHRKYSGISLGLRARGQTGFRSRPDCGLRMLGGMADVTQILSAIEAGDPHAAADLLPLVYDELRKLAAVRLAEEKPGQTLQPTALVHEAYLRLVSGEQPQDWNGRGHFFAAAAEAMRRILIDRARHKVTAKRGGGRMRVDLDQVSAADDGREAELLALDDALTEFERHDPQAAQLVKLRYFVGLSHQEAADALGIGRRAADRLWVLARAWLYQRLTDEK
jgi:RNA polymerase sigma factor (TIGR02999 family)